jgi:hypothetical protein
MRSVLPEAGGSVEPRKMGKDKLRLGGVETSVMGHSA